MYMGRTGPILDWFKKEVMSSLWTTLSGFLLEKSFRGQKTIDHCFHCSFYCFENFRGAPPCSRKPVIKYGAWKRYLHTAFTFWVFTETRIAFWVGKLFWFLIGISLDKASCYVTAVFLDSFPVEAWRDSRNSSSNVDFAVVQMKSLLFKGVTILSELYSTMMY